MVTLIAVTLGWLNWPDRTARAFLAQLRADDISNDVANNPDVYPLGLPPDVWLPSECELVLTPKDRSLKQILLGGRSYYVDTDHCWLELCICRGEVWRVYWGIYVSGLRLTQ